MSKIRTPLSCNNQNTQCRALLLIRRIAGAWEALSFDERTALYELAPDIGIAADMMRDFVAGDRETVFGPPDGDADREWIGLARYLARHNPITG